jgi:hypothetical protein
LRLSGGGFFRGLTIRNNSAASRGGGIFVGASDFLRSVLIQDSKITGNNAGSFDGGGIYLFASNGFQGDMAIRNTTIANNTAGDEGGGIRVIDGGLAVGMLIENSTISGNSAGADGGGIHFYSGGMLTLRNSTVSGNSAGGNGGGIFLDMFGGDARIANSTIAFNTALGDGGGIFVEDDTVDLLSTIVGRNSATGGNNDLSGGGIVNALFSLIQDDMNIGGLIFNDNGFNVLGVNPRLKPLANNGGPTRTHGLRANSPAINAGFNFAASPFDQRGAPFLRTVGVATDIGAVERQ